MGVMESSWALRLVVASSLPILYWIRHSLPFSWHLRVLLPYYVRRWRYTSTKPGPGISLGNPMLQLDALPIGKDPFVESYSMSFQATVDDCDFMGHLSNSCYPKSLDISRSHFAADILLQFASDGGYVPLASTSFKFVKKISFLAKYTIRSDVYAWGEKWFYLRNQFVSRSKQGDETVHCISITKHCYKLGRKTIPPWFVMAYSGYSPSTSVDRLANWKKSQALRIQLQKINPRDNPLKAFQPVRGLESPKEEWMSPEYWDLGDWQEECHVRIKQLYQYY